MEEKQTLMQESLQSWCDFKSRGTVSSGVTPGSRIPRRRRHERGFKYEKRE